MRLKKNVALLFVCIFIINVVLTISLCLSFYSLNRKLNDEANKDDKIDTYIYEDKNSMVIIKDNNLLDERILFLDNINNKNNYNTSYDKVYFRDKFSTKSYMDYRKITNEESIQYKYIQENMVIGMDGLLRYKDDTEIIGVALGSYWGDISEKYIVQLEDSEGVIRELKIVKVEQKADIHTFNGFVQKWDKSVIEFVIDEDLAMSFFGGNNGYVLNGDFNNHIDYQGKLISAMKIKE